jgi:DNA-directed RNA polymerase sigma subunit (sigma70/sigma32)
MVDRINRMFRVIKDLEQELGGKPTPEDIAIAMEMDISKVNHLLDIIHHIRYWLSIFDIINIYGKNTGNESCWRSI